MKLSSRTFYSLRLLVYLSDNAYRKKPITLKEISTVQNLPQRYLEQIVMLLRSAGLIKSVQGKQGGYYLAKDPNDIKIAEILNATTDQIEFLHCINDQNACKFHEVCCYQYMWGLIKTLITDFLEEFSVAELSEKKMIEKLEKMIPEEADLQISCKEVIYNN